MINGIPHVTFPGPVWFLPEYDLSRIYPEGHRTDEAMYVIAKCCSIRPNDRPTLIQLKTMLESLALDNPPPEMTLGANALKREQELEVEYAQRQAIARPFVTRLTADLERALVSLQDSNPESLLIHAWLTEWNRIPNRTEALIQQVVVHESDAPVMNVLRRQHTLNTRFFPEGMNGPLRFRVAFGRTHERNPHPRLTVEARDSGLVAKIEYLSNDPETADYSPETLANFLLRAIDAA